MKLEVTIKILLSLIAVLTCVGTSNIPEVEYIALESLFNSTDGQGWDWKTPYSSYGYPWIFNSTYRSPCNNWQGVGCSCHQSNQICTVTTIFLSNYNLQGYLPENFASLVNLTSFSFFGNNITGPLPSSLGNLTKLSRFDISYNRFTGSIPSSFANLTALTDFYVMGNKLGDQLPTNLFQSMIRLRIIEFGSNNFTGPLPSLESQELLIDVDFSNNRFSGPLVNGWSHLHLLTSIVLHNNLLTGTLPIDWGMSFPSLKYLELYSNLLSETLPAIYGNFSTLLRMVIFNNRFTGSFPSEWCNLQSLELLELYGNSLNGSIPNCLCNMTSIQRLSFQTNFFTGTIPHDLGLLTNLKLADFSVNKLMGSLPPTIGSAIVLDDFSVNNNFLSGTLPISFTQLGNLTQCALSYNFFNGTLPSNIGDMQNLIIFILTRNQFSGRIPKSLGLLFNVDSLDLSYNAFTGKIPPELFSNMPVIDTLSLSTNFLTGSIPEEFYSLSSLSYFGAGQNQLNGSISSLIENMIGMEQFYVLFNNLSGEIPASLGKLPSLSALGLAGNKFVGSIPPELFPVNSSLSAIFFSNNQLYGEIPPSIVNATQLTQLLLAKNFFDGSLENIDFSNFTSLYTVDLSENSFYGSIPTSFWTRPKLRNVLLDDNEFSGSIDVPVANVDYSDSFYSLSALIIGSNQFTGPVLSSASALPKHGRHIKYLNLSSNHFSGELDSSILQWKQTVGLGIASNAFSGRVQNLFTNMSQLVTLTLSSNFFTGHLSNLINTQESYISVAVDNNAFSGSLPADLLSKGNLQSFVASINCLSGTLPQNDLCANSYVQEILLDGLHSSTFCDDQRSTLFGLSKATISGDKQVVGSFPECLLQSLPKLRVLHLSGNALMGRHLQNIHYVSANLAELDLSHNLLTGSVPSAIWSHNFSSKLDLSFNQLSGIVSDSLSPVYSEGGSNATLSLQINRFSGRIPSSLQYAPDVNILEGNMFSCNSNGLYFSAQQKHLPRNDPSIGTYECGSDATNTSLIAVCVLSIILVLCLFFAMVGWGKSHVEMKKLPDWTTWSRWQHYLYLSRVKLHFWWTAFADPSLVSTIPAIQIAHNSLEALLKYLRYFSIGMIAGGVPLYVLLSYFFGTYTYQYVWTAALTFLRGIVPTVILFVFLCIILCSLLSISMYQRRVAKLAYTGNNGQETTSSGEKFPTSSATPPVQTAVGDDSRRQEDEEKATEVAQNDVESNQNNNTNIVARSQVPDRSTAKVRRPMISYIFNTLVVLIDIVVVISVNAAYVFALGKGLGVHALVFVSLTVSIFKLSWNTVVLGEVVAKQSTAWVSRSWLCLCSCHRFFRRCMGCHLSHDETMAPDFTNAEREMLGLSTAVHVMLSIFNNVVAPYLAEAFVSANCFKYVFTRAPLISSTSQGSGCYLTIYDFAYTNFEGVTESGTTGKLSCEPLELIPSNETIALTFSRTTTITYYPAFTYSFQCSSSLLTSFVTIFILRYIISGLVLPLVTISLKSYQHSLAVRLASYARRPRPPPLAKQKRIEWWFRTVTMLLPGPLRLLESMAYAKKSAALPITTPIPPRGWIQGNILNFRASEFRIYSTWFNVDGNKVEAQTMTEKEEANNSLSHRFFDDQDAEQERLFFEDLNRVWIIPKLLFRPWNVANSLYIRLVADLAVLCTFGVLFPPLVLVVAGAMTVDLFCTKLIVARALRHFQGWISLLSQEAFVLNEILQSTNNRTRSTVNRRTNAAPSVYTSHNMTSMGFNPMLDYSEQEDGNQAPDLLMDHEQEARRFKVVVTAMENYQSLSTKLNQSFDSFSESLWKGVRLIALVAACFWSLSLFDILGNEVGATNASPVVALMVFAPLWLAWVAYTWQKILKTCNISCSIFNLMGEDAVERNNGKNSQISSIATLASANNPISTSSSNMSTSTSVFHEASQERAKSIISVQQGSYTPPSMPIPNSTQTSATAAGSHRSLRATPATLPALAGSYLGAGQSFANNNIMSATGERQSIFSNEDDILSVPHDMTDDDTEVGDIRLTMSSSMSVTPRPKSPSS